MSKYMIAAASTQRDFGRAAHPETASHGTAYSAKDKRRRTPPVSVRFSDRELAALKKQAGDQPLGTYIKSKVFAAGSDAPTKRTAVQEYELLARVLSTLGQSEVFQNLRTITKAVENGDLCLSDEQEDSIALACLLVIEIRDELIKALGLRPK